MGVQILISISVVCDSDTVIGPAEMWSSLILILMGAAQASSSIDIVIYQCSLLF